MFVYELIVFIHSIVCSCEREFTFSIYSNISSLNFISYFNRINNKYDYKCILHTRRQLFYSTIVHVHHIYLPSAILLKYDYFLSPSLFYLNLGLNDKMYIIYNSIELDLHYIYYCNNGG